MHEGNKMWIQISPSFKADTPQTEVSTVTGDFALKTCEQDIIHTETAAWGFEDRLTVTRTPFVSAFSWTRPGRWNSTLESWWLQILLLLNNKK